ncbi:hypothetical protein, partial [Klebsiella pneumoniae]
MEVDGLKKYFPLRDGLFRAHAPAARGSNRR